MAWVSATRRAAQIGRFVNTFYKNLINKISANSIDKRKAGVKRKNAQGLNSLIERV